MKYFSSDDPNIERVTKLLKYEHKSFPLPYEMPMNTFYGKPPKKNGASGTATPIEEDTNDASSATPSHEPPHTPSVATPTRSTRAGKQNKNSTKKNLKQHSSGSVDSQNGSFYVAYLLMTTLRELI